jgi:phosphoheptose isomerase
MAQATPVGSEIPVNIYTPLNQGRPAVAMGGGGAFVVAWDSNGQDGSGYGIFARRFNSAGAPQGAEFQVNAYTTGNQVRPALGQAANGDFVVAWETYRQDGSIYGIFARQFNSAGAPQGAEFQVNAYTLLNQFRPAVGRAANGDFVVAWESFDGFFYGIFARRFDSAGAPQAAEFQVNAYTAGIEWFSSVGVSSEGDFVVAWQDSSQDGSLTGVFARRFNALGVPEAAEFQVNSYTMYDQAKPSVGIDPDGHFVVAWQSTMQDASGDGIFARRFDAAGMPQAAELQINTFTSGGQITPAVALDGDGDFVITWVSGGQDGSDSGVFARRFDAAGAPQDAEFQVNTYTTNAQNLPAVALTAGGDFVVAWQSPQDGSQVGIFAQRFKVPKIFDIDANGATDALTDGLLFLRYTFGFRDAVLISGAVAGNCTRCTPALVAGYVDGIVGVTLVKPAGPELQVNSYTGGEQLWPALATDSAGSFVVAWGSAQDGSESGIIARRFGSTGSPLAPEFQVNDYATDRQYLPAVAAAADGRFVVAWASYLQDGSNLGVFARRFDAAGVPQAIEFQLNTLTTSSQNDPAVALEPDGDFVVAWQSLGQEDVSYGIFAKRFDSAGVPRGSEFQLNTYTPGNQVQASVAIGADGRFVVAWTSGGQDGDGVGVFARRFDSAGAPQATELQVNTYTASSQHRPSAAFGDAGGFVVAWQSFLQDGDGDGIFARTFNASGAPQAGEFQVNTTTPSFQRYAGAAAADGQFIVTWQSFGQDGSFYGVFARRFASTGAAQASEFQVNTYVTGEQIRPAVAANHDGDFAVAWQSVQDGCGAGIFARPYESSRAGDIDGNGVVAPLTDGLLVLRYLFGFRDGTLITGAVGAGCTRCTAPAIEGYLAANV